jgi:large subunit ribosomal protein L3
MNETMGLVGKKVGMLQLFGEDGSVIPVTLIELGPNVVTQVKSAATKDGYTALQLGLGAKKERLVTKAAAGHAKAANTAAPANLAEIRVDEKTAAAYAKGAAIGVADVFKKGELVDVMGQSKGRGFQGVMKRHHFKGFERSHGCHEYYRHGGSIGTRLTPGMTMAGMKMPGHMGDKQRTIQNLEVVKVDAERNLIYVRGAIPGAPGGVVTVRHRVKNVKNRK